MVFESLTVKPSSVAMARLTVREGDLEWFGGVSEVPQRQAAVRVTAHERLPLMVPADGMDGLKPGDTKQEEWFQFREV